jgi:hypothetical protein
MAAAKDSTVLPPVMDEALVDVGPRTAEHTRIHLVPVMKGRLAIHAIRMRLSEGASHSLVTGRTTLLERRASRAAATRS